MWETSFECFFRADSEKNPSLNVEETFFVFPAFFCTKTQGRVGWLSSHVWGAFRCGAERPLGRGGGQQRKGETFDEVFAEPIACIRREKILEIITLIFKFGGCRVRYFFPILICPIPKQNSVGKSSNTKKEEKKDKETGGRRKTKYQLCFPFHFFAALFFPVPFFDIQGLGRRPPAAAAQPPPPLSRRRRRRRRIIRGCCRVFSPCDN